MDFLNASCRTEVQIFLLFVRKEYCLVIFGGEALFLLLASAPFVIAEKRPGPDEEYITLLCCVVFPLVIPVPMNLSTGKFADLFIYKFRENLF